MVEIERKNAGIEAISAEGIAKANGITNMTLTAEYLQHELNLALQEFTETGLKNERRKIAAYPLPNIWPSLAL